VVSRTAGKATLIAGILAALPVAPPAAAYGPPAGAIQMGFDSAAPGIPSGLRMRLSYRDSTAPDGKAPMIRELQIRFPDGTRFVEAAVPRCEASDQEVQARGPSACPPASKVGSGEIETVTGFGPPADPLMLDTVNFNERGGVKEVVMDRSSGAVIAVEHLMISDNVMNARIARGPGGPPDGETTVREAVVNLDPGTGFLVTPPTCAGGVWDYSARYTFDNGVAEAAGSTPCRVSRAQLVVHPQHVRAGRSQRFSLRAVAIRDGRRRSLDGALIRFAGRTVAADRHGRAVVVAALPPGLHRAAVVSPQVRGGVARVRAIARR
jgi:hypothetical protein